MDSNEKNIVAIDLGSSKIALTVARVSDDDIQIIYYRETPSTGIKYSSIYKRCCHRKIRNIFNFVVTFW